MMAPQFVDVHSPSSPGNMNMTGPLSPLSVELGGGPLSPQQNSGGRDDVNMNMGVGSSESEIEEEEDGMAGGFGCAMFSCDERDDVYEEEEMMAAEAAEQAEADEPMSPSKSLCSCQGGRGQILISSPPTSPAVAAPSNSNSNEEEEAMAVSPRSMLSNEGRPLSPTTSVVSNGAVLTSGSADSKAVPSVKSLFSDSDDETDAEAEADVDVDTDKVEQEQQEEEDEEDEEVEEEEEQAPTELEEFINSKNNKASKAKKTKASKAKKKSKEKKEKEKKKKKKPAVVKKVAFVARNPPPLSPLSVQDCGPLSNRSEISESMLSPRGDDEETLTLESGMEEEPDWCDEEEPDWCDEVTEDDNAKTRSLLSKAKGRLIKKPQHAKNKNKTAPSYPGVVEIPDDDSEASIMVLMRYMGCTPVAYADDEDPLHPTVKWLDANGDASTTPRGREFFFGSIDDDDENSLLSDEGTYASYVSHDVKQSWTLKNEEVGVEMGLDDLVLASPPMSPRSGATPVISPKSPVSPGSLKLPLSPKEKAEEILLQSKTKKKKKSKKGKPNLTVDTDDVKRQKKLKKLLAREGISSEKVDAVLSDDDLRAFLSGEEPTSPVAADEEKDETGTAKAKATKKKSAGSKAGKKKKKKASAVMSPKQSEALSKYRKPKEEKADAAAVEQEEEKNVTNVTSPKASDRESDKESSDALKKYRKEGASTPKASDRKVSAEEEVQLLVKKGKIAAEKEALEKAAALMANGKKTKLSNFLQKNAIKPPQGLVVDTDPLSQEVSGLSPTFVQSPVSVKSNASKRPSSAKSQSSVKSKSTVKSPTAAVQSPVSVKSNAGTSIKSQSRVKSPKAAAAEPPSTSNATEFVGSYLSSPKTGDDQMDKESLMSGLSEPAVSSPTVHQLATALSPENNTQITSPANSVRSPVNSVPSSANVALSPASSVHIPTAENRSAPSVDAPVDTVLSDDAKLQKLIADAVDAPVHTVLSDDEKLQKIIAEATADAELSLAKSPMPPATSILNNEDASTSQVYEIGKIEKSPSNRSDKENSSLEASNAKATPLAEKDPLTVEMGSVANQEVPLSISVSQPTPVSPSRESVREVDALLSKTRSWLIRHNESQPNKSRAPFPTPNSGGHSILPALSTSMSSERQVMGNITAKTVLNSENSTSSSSSSALPLKSSTPGSLSLMDQLKSSKDTSTRTASAALLSTLTSSTSSSGGAPKKSILEQLGEIRAKQREIELRQMKAKAGR